MRQNTADWLEIRKNHIGSSDSPIIMGVSKFKRSDGRRKTPYILWLEKLDLIEKDTPNLSMRFGIENEETARKSYEEITGEMVYPHVCFHKDYKFMMASLDGINLKKDKIVEIKNAGKEDHETARQGKIPSHYYPQLQHQLDCCDLEHMDYFSFNQGKGICVKVYRDEKYIKDLHEKLEKFWECLYNFKTPDLTEDDYIERDSSWNEKAEELWRIKQKKAAILSQEKEIEKELKRLSDNKSSFCGNMIYSKSFAKGIVDYSLIPELQGVDLEKYRKPPFSKWRLKLHQK